MSTPIWKLLVSPQPSLVEPSDRWVWLIPKESQLPGCCTEVCTASREWWEYLQDGQKPLAPGMRIGHMVVSHVTAERLTFDYEGESGAWFWFIHFVDIWDGDQTDDDYSEAVPGGDY